MSQTAVALAAYEPRPSSVPVVLTSIIFHLLIFIIIPLATTLLSRPRVVVRPATFQLMSMPKARSLPQAAAAPAPAPVEAVSKDTKQVPKTDKKKPLPKTAPKDAKTAPAQETKKVEEDLSELNDLLGGLSTPVSSVAYADNFPYSWYERNITMKVERNWRPPVEDEKIAILVSFTIKPDGSIVQLAIKKGSGNAMLDNLAMRAVQMAAPFGKLPPAYASDHLDVEYTLRPSRR